MRAAFLACALLAGTPDAFAVTTCRQAVRIVESSVIADHRALARYIEAELRALDARHAARGDATIISGLSENGLIDTIAMVSVHCHNHPTKTTAAAAAFVYDGLRGLALTLGAIKPRRPDYAATAGEWKVEGHTLPGGVFGCKAELIADQDHTLIYFTAFDAKEMRAEASVAITTRLEDDVPADVSLIFDRQPPVVLSGRSEGGFMTAGLQLLPTDRMMAIIGMLRTSAAVTIVVSPARGDDDRVTVRLAGSDRAIHGANACVGSLVKKATGAR